MTIYNMKPSWLQIKENTEQETGEKLTPEEIIKLRENTLKYSYMLGDMMTDKIDNNQK